MQRWLFFLFLLITAASLQAQPLHSELSYWFCPEAPRCLTIKGQVSYPMLRAKAKTTLRLQAAPHINIKSIRLKQGRLKDSLLYERQKNEIRIEWPAQLAGESELWIEFELSTEKLAEPYYQQTADFVAFNPFKLQGQDLPAEAGYFYPAFAGIKTPLKVNLTLPAGQNSGLPGTLSFISDNQDGTISHYWDSYASYAPEDFFLIVGHFSDFDQEEISEDFDFVVLDTRHLRAEQVARRLSPWLSFSGEEPPQDSLLLLADSLKALPQPIFYVTASDFTDLSPADQRLIKSYLLQIKGINEQELSDTLEAFGIDRYGQPWLDSIHVKRWQQRDSLPRAFAQRALGVKLDNFLANNPWIAQELDVARWQHSFRDSVLRSFQFPRLSVDFRYVAGDERFYVNYLQDTKQAPVYAVPLKILVVTRDDSLYHYSFLSDTLGRVGIALSGAPYYAEVTAGEGFLGQLSEQKPDTYHLYALAKAQNPADKREALRALLQTNNPNLFSTTLGIALDDESEELRLLALARVGELNALGRRKLEDSLRQISRSDPSAQVRKEAQEALLKYYEGK